MVRSFVLRSMVAGLCLAAVGSVSADNRVSVSKKGSLLMWSKVELVFTPDGVLIQDTFIDMSNDYPDDVEVQFYFVNGDAPLAPVFVGNPPNQVLVERGHPGWNWADCQIRLTANQPTYMSMASGLPAGCQPFTVLDPAAPPAGPGRPNPDFQVACPAGFPIGTICSLNRVLRGFVYAWAVDNNGNPIRWNHLTGDAMIINYARGTSAEYSAYAAAACPEVNGVALCGHDALVPDAISANGREGTLALDGVHYDWGYDKVLMDYYATNSGALSKPAPAPIQVTIDTDVTLHPISADLRQDNDGPVTTKAKYDVWNQNEIRLSGMTKCITCWDQTFASRYTNPNYFLRLFLQTDKGKARIDGVRSDDVCDVPARNIFSVNASILGIQIKNLAFVGIAGGFATSALNMVGQGEESATIKWDIIAPPDEAQQGTAGAGVGTAGTVKNGRTSR